MQGLAETPTAGAVLGPVETAPEMAGATGDMGKDGAMVIAAMAIAGMLGVTIAWDWPYQERASRCLAVMRMLAGRVWAVSANLWPK
jgi:hypothetical protein